MSTILAFLLVNRWYPGTITTKIGEEFHFVKYDDGDQRRYCMELHTFKILDKSSGAVARQFVKADKKRKREEL